MRIIFIVLVICFFGSCESNNVVHYKSVYDLYVNNNDNSSLELENGLFTFYKTNNINNKNNLFFFGFYKDGLRTSNWTYKKDNELHTIEWGVYKDKRLNIETNVFKNIDSCIHIDEFTVLKFKVEGEDISLTLSKNNDILKQVKQGGNYQLILQKKLSQIGYKMLSCKEHDINNSNEKLFSYIMSFQKNRDPIKYLYTCYTFINDSLSVEFTIKTQVKNSYFAKVLFDGVVSNCYVNNKRIYRPW